MHYIGLFPPILLAALAGCWLFRGKWKLPEKTVQNSCLFFTGLVFCIYALLGWWKYGAFQFGLWDFGIYDSFLHNTAFGKGFLRDFRGGLYDHFSPLMLILVPFYWICDTPMHLVWFQSLAMAAGIPVMYMLARKYLRSPEMALVLAMLYALNPYYSRLALYDFHSECMFPAMFLGGVLLWARGRRFWAMGLWMSCYLIKEDFAVPLAGLGLYFLFARNTRKYGVILLLWSVLMTLFVLKIYFPLLSEKGYWHYGRYELLAPTLAGTWENLLAVCRRVFCERSGTVLLTLLLPFALLPVLHWRMFLLVLVPTLGIQLASSADHQNLLISHYSSALIGVVPLAALWGMRVWQKQMRRRKWPVRYERNMALFLLIVGVGYHITCCDLPLTRYYSYVDRWEMRRHMGILSLPFAPDYYLAMLEQEVNGEALRQVLAMIPAGSRVVCQNELGCPLIRTHQVSSMPGDDGADFYLFDGALYSGFDYHEKLNNCIRKCAADPACERIFYKDGILLFARKKTGDK